MALIAMHLAVPAMPAQAISGGSSVNSASQFPYMVSVEAPVIMCAGALVSLEHVVTTASCVNTLAPADVVVHTGSNTYYSGGVTRSVAAITIHKNFNSTNYDSNIAVLTLSDRLPSSESIAPIPLPVNGLPPVNSSAVITSFGAINAASALPDVLQKAQLTLFGSAACQSLKNNRLTSTMFCAGDPTGVKDACLADQGAPLAYQGQLIGIYNWGASCGLAAPHSSSPVFNNVAVFTSWIKNVIATT